MSGYIPVLKIQTISQQRSVKSTGKRIYFLRLGAEGLNVSACLDTCLQVKFKVEEYFNCPLKEILWYATQFFSLSLSKERRGEGGDGCYTKFYNYY